MQCGARAVEGRVELDGSVTYLCEQHIDGKPPDTSDAGGGATEDEPQR